MSEGNGGSTHAYNENKNNNSTTLYTSQYVFKANNAKPMITPDFMAEGVNPMKVPPIQNNNTRWESIPARNAPITPPLITHDRDRDRDYYAVPIKDNKKKKRDVRDLRSRGGERANDGRKSRQGLCHICKA